MRKRLFTLMVASFAMLSYQAVANNEAENESARMDFEDGSVVDGEDIKAGYDNCMWEVTDNPVAEDGWGGDENNKKDALNSSASCLKITREEGSAIWAGPVVRLPQPVTVSSQDPTTHFLHIQAMLPDGLTTGAGKFVINAYGHDWEKGASDPRIISDGDPGTVAYPSDYEAMHWVEFSYDLRKYMGQTFTMIQLQPERGGSLTTYVDNIVIDDRRGDFAVMDFGTPVNVEEGDYFIFMPGTKYAVTSSDPLAIGNIQTSFVAYSEDMVDYQAWEIALTGEKDVASNAPLFTIANGGLFLQSDGKLYDEEEGSTKQSWFFVKKNVRINADEEGVPAKYEERSFLVNAASYTWLGMGEVMADLECVSSTDSASNWTLIPYDDLDSYLASDASVGTPVKEQVPNGDYYIFYAGTNYCATDPRPMEWVTNADFATAQGKETQKMYLPQHTVDQGYPLVLQEYDPENDGQVWTLRNYAEDVDMEYTHTFINYYLGRQNWNNGFYPIVTERWHWAGTSNPANDDSTTRAVGARLITGKMYQPECIDSLGNAFTFDYQPVWGDNGKMNSHKNDQRWFVKRVVMNDKGMVAMYRPNNGVQGVFVSNDFDGASITAHANDQVGTFEEESSMYVWNFVSADTPLSKEDAAALKDPNKKFGVPMMPTPGRYRIQFTGTRMVMGYRPDGDPTNRDWATMRVYDADSIAAQVWTLQPVSAEDLALAPEKYQKQNYHDLFQLVNEKGQYLWGMGGNHYLRTDVKENMVADENYHQSFIQGVSAGDGKYVMTFMNDEGTRWYIKPYEKVVEGTMWSNTGMPDGYDFELVPEDQEITGRAYGEKIHIEPGYYYIQSAYTYDTTEVDGVYDETTPWVLTPNTTIGNDVPNVMQKYSADSAFQTWYITYADSNYTASTQRDTIAPNYFMFASNTIADAKAAGATDYELITKNDSSYVFNDWSKMSNGKNFTWFTQSFYESDGKIAIKDAQHSRWFADYVAVADSTKYPLNVVTTNSTQAGAISDDNFADRYYRSYIWYLIPANNGNPELKKPVRMAPWIAELKGIDDGVEEIEDAVAGEALDCISVSANTITVTGQEGAKVKVATVAGAAVAEIASADEVETITVAAGAYVVTVNGKSAVVLVY